MWVCVCCNCCYWEYLTVAEYLDWFIRIEFPCINIYESLCWMVKRCMIGEDWQSQNIHVAGQPCIILSNQRIHQTMSTPHVCLTFYTCSTWWFFASTSLFRLAIFNWTANWCTITTFNKWREINSFNWPFQLW